MEIHNATWPIYALAQEEAVEKTNGLPVVIEPILMTGQATGEDVGLIDESGLLLFSSSENAEKLLPKTERSQVVVATFRDKKHLLLCLQNFIDQGCPLVIFDRYSDGSTYEINLFLSIVERQF